MSPCPSQENIYVQRINAVIGHVREHLNDDLPLDALARVAGFSPFHFHRVFKSINEETLNELVVRLRLERAVSLLRSTPELSVTDAAKAFHGDLSQNWLILKNGEHVIGLFQGMFEKNILTFNPGWDQDPQPLDTFTDVRELQRQLKAQGLEFMSEADESTMGPASFIIMDPDGNPVFVDQHV
jgi:lactoylglutathione lyase